MKIIVGIGNPGKAYADTRHNVGFFVVDALARAHGVDGWRHRFHGAAVECRIGGERVLLLKPDTYVNESGRSVGAAAHWCRSQPQDIMIVCDDFNLDVARIRIRRGGSSGGHKGLSSIMSHLDTEDAPRLRIGIGIAPSGKAKDFVLSRFACGERDEIEEAVNRAVRALEVWLEYGLERCQCEFNTRAGETSPTQIEEADA